MGLQRGGHNWVTLTWRNFGQDGTLIRRGVQFSSVTQSCPTLTVQLLQLARLPCPSPTPRACSNSCSSSRWCHPTISFCHPFLLPPSIFPSIRVFSNESVLLIRWPKYWSFSFNISPSNEYSGLISFGIDWFDFLAIQGTLKSLLQHYASKASILGCFLYDPVFTSITWLLGKNKNKT